MPVPFLHTSSDPDTDAQTQELPYSKEGIASGSADDPAFLVNCQALIRAAAEGTVANADKALPWPPPLYIWRSRTAAQILSLSPFSLSPAPLSLGCLSVDAQLGGGIPSGAVVEVAGKAGSGKTQLALSLAAETVIRLFDRISSSDQCVSGQAEARFTAGLSTDGLHISQAGVPPLTAGERPAPVVYYIHTEGGFPVHRLNEIITSRGARLAAERALADAGRQATCSSSKTMMQRILMDEISSEEQLWIALTRRLPRLLISHGVKLLVIDSIAAVFRTTEASDSRGKGLVDRATKLMRVGAVLRRYAAEFGCCCLVLNQVSDLFLEEADTQLAKSGETPVGEMAGKMEQRRPTDERDSSGGYNSLDGRTGIRQALCWRSASDGIDGALVWRDRHATNNPRFIACEHSGVQPALGGTWSNCIHFRFMVHKLSQTRSEVVNEDRFSEVIEGAQCGLRCLRNVFGSGIRSCEDIFFKIGAEGVVDP